MTLLCGLIMGADGGIGATYNIMPKLFVKIYESFRAGNIAEAQETQFKVIQVLLKYGVINGLRDVLERLGFHVGYPTYPLKRFTPLEREEFHKELDKIGFFEISEVMK
jgi:N-acetylneuraminate lyase